MTYFSPDFIEFFKELASNNHKDWFATNKKRYEKEVKKPFYALVDDLFKHVSQIDQGIAGTAKDAVFRINRDVRFSADKTPYNIHVSAALVPGGRKSNQPGFYLRLTPEGVHMGGGIYAPDKDSLQKIRQHISNNLEELSAIINASDFINHFNEVKGDSVKRIPKELKPVFDKQPLIAKKQFFYMADHNKPELIYSEQLTELILEYFRAASQIHHFLREALRE